ncbi:FAD-binding oxidoreductase [Actinophytocola algeriensis]|uniref:FAD/FMN-containing dehydrogenase n=1 Tax=Actinophytocola algeriensis TaxID=1768010 RepID=A0A7W7VIN0_9PSEU|nr:FAD-binding oxidoreductase [Actinophytocola algeriensis]MBB4911444.1 FAD/FMN-containing dehydrogenase [Actinophytocola algeriensis]MBE1479383.1 FAD/FMN-containing dehydrogenase [Actinophytocola algeriensis]
MPDLTALRDAIDGDVCTPGSPGYDTVRRPAHAACPRVSPRLVVRCRSVSDVVAVVRFATATGDRVAPRGGGHCFAGRSSTDGIVLDLSGLDAISVAEDGVATIGAGARLGQVYAALHPLGRTLPAGCGPTVGITGLTLGGGIGLLGREHGLTCDRLVGAQVVLASGTVVDTDHEPELLWALRGAGGGQFGVVTSLRFATVPEPVTTRIEAHVPLDDVVGAWQAWAPDAPDGLTVNLTLVSEPGAPVRAVLFSAATLGEDPTRTLLREFTGRPVELRGGLPVHELKRGFDDLPATTGRMRSEFFSRALSGRTLASLLTQLGEPRNAGRRQLTFTAMGGAYNRVAEDATAFAHRGARFLLEHAGEAADPWVDRSWATAHTNGSGWVYPNFPDACLDDWATAYHGANHPRLTAVKRVYDPHRFFDFPQAI